MRFLLLSALFLPLTVGAQREWFAHDASLLTMQRNVQHQIDHWSVTADERHLITSTEREVAVWNLDRLRVVKSFPVSHCLSVDAHPVDPDLFYFRFDDSYDGDRRSLVVNWRTGHVVCRTPQASLRDTIAVRSRPWRAFIKGDRGHNLFDVSLKLLLQDRQRPDPYKALGGEPLENLRSLVSDATDSLLYEQGDIPLTWDLRRGSLVAAPIPATLPAANPKPSTLNTLDPGEVRNIHRYPVSHASASHDGRRLYTCDRGGTTAVWDAHTGRNICAMDVMGTADRYIIHTPDQYYKTSPDAYRFVHFAKDNEVYDFRQFDLRQNRPDIIVERLGGDPAYVEKLHKAWLKRLRRQGLTPEMLSADMHTPVAEIANAAGLRGDFQGKESSVTLRLRLSDTRVPLHRVRATLCGVPLLGAEGQEITGQECEMQLPVELVQGENVIEVWALNSEGAESPRATLRLMSKREQAAPRLFVAAVGVSRYAQDAYSLHYAHKDAADFARHVSGVASDFAEVKTLTLTDGEFLSGSLDRLRSFFAQTCRGDVAVLFFAGHGVLDDALDYWLAPHDMDFSRPSAHGVSYADFTGVMDGAAALSRYAVIDACHSGAIDREDYLAANVQSLAPAGGAGSIVFRGGGSLAERSREASEVSELLGENFFDAAAGATVMTSASGTEVAVEDAAMQNGLFTYCLNGAMRRGADGGYGADADGDDRLTLDEVLEWAGHEARRLSGGRQTPAFRSRNMGAAIPVLYRKTKKQE